MLLYSFVLFSNYSRNRSNKSHWVAVSHPRNVPANVAQLQVGGWNWWNNMIRWEPELQSHLQLGESCQCLIQWFKLVDAVHRDSFQWHLAKCVIPILTPTCFFSNRMSCCNTQVKLDIRTLKPINIIQRFRDRFNQRSPVDTPNMIPSNLTPQKCWFGTRSKWADKVNNRFDSTSFSCWALWVVWKQEVARGGRFFVGTCFTNDQRLFLVSLIGGIGDI